MKIAKYNIPNKDSNDNRTASAVIYGNNATYTSSNTVDYAKQLSETHLIFGQPFNGTQDVAGDITNVQNITNEGDINVKSYTDDTGTHGGNITADGDITCKDVFGENAYINGVVYADELGGNYGYINRLEGAELNYNSAEIAELLSQDITTKNLTVTGTAHFFELIIDKIKAAGGAVILSPADGFKVEKVRKVNSTPAIYQALWKATDGEKAISNMWKKGDLAVCRSFNNATLGTSYNVSNKYYWVEVTATGIMTIDNQDYHYIEFWGSVDRTKFAGVVNPEVGDEIAMLGSRATKDDGTPDLERQSAIYISAYSSMDTGLKAPFIAQYTGINDFNLSSHRYTWLAHNGNELRGNLKIASGETISEVIDSTTAPINNKIAELEVTANGLTSTVQNLEENTNSLIQQTANNILLKVNELSLKIDNQRIVLDGNTEIKGNLNINNSESGFTLQGEGGNTQISPKSIGTFSEFSATSSISDSLSKQIKTSIPNPDAMSYNPSAGEARPANRHYVLNYEMTYNIGALVNGDFIEFKDQALSFSAADGGAMSSGMKKYEILKGSTVVKTFTTYSNIQSSLFSYNVTADGNYTLRLTINFTADRTYNGTTDYTSPNNDLYYFGLPFTADFSVQLIKPTGDAHMLIGYDGIAANFGNNKTVYIGKNETTIKYGNYGLRVSSTGIQKYNGTSWVTANI